MKVKVTNTGITQKGTTSHVIISNSSNFNHTPTVTTISAVPHSNTIPRVPNKPPLTPLKSFLTMEEFAATSNSLSKGNSKITVSKMIKTPQPIAVVSVKPPIQNASTVFNHLSQPSSKPQSDTKSNRKSKPLTQAIAISINPKKVPIKNPAPLKTVVQSRTTSNIKPEIRNKLPQHLEVTVSQEKVSSSSNVKNDAPVIKSIQNSTKETNITEVPQIFIQMPIDKGTTFSTNTGFGSADNSLPISVVASMSKSPMEHVRVYSTPITKKAPVLKKPKLVSKQQPKKIKVEIILPNDEKKKASKKRKAETPASTVPAKKCAKTKPEKKARKTSGDTKGLLPLQLNTEVVQIPKIKQADVWKEPVPEKPKNQTGGTTVSNSTASASSNKSKPSAARAKVLTKQSQHSYSPVAEEIKNLLHAFGDSSEPMKGSVEIVEAMLKHELGGFIQLCEYKASLRTSKRLGLTEAILVLKSNIPRVDRMYRHFAVRDIYSKKCARKPGVMFLAIYTKEIHRIIKYFNLRELCHLLKLSLDEIEANYKGTRALTDEAQDWNPEMRKFFEYTRIRSLSLAKKLSTLNIRRWMIAACRIHAKVSEAFVYILDFLTLELVAELVDAAFEIRKERCGNKSDPRVLNPDTCMSAPTFLKKRKDDHCNQVSEILVQASEMEATRLKKQDQGRLKARLGDFSSPAPVLYPVYLEEAYMRFQSNRSLPSFSFRNRANLVRPCF